VSTHFDHVETAYSFRTRILDYLWAGLPTVTTAGDVLADLLTASGAGAAVPPTDVEALTAVLAELLDDGGRRDSMSRAATSLGNDLQWSRVLAPLVEYCRAPHRAPDLLDATVTHSIHRGGDLLPHLWVRRGQRAIAMARRGDWGELRERVNSRWRGRAPGAPR
jgi:hypothetical protein